MRCRHINQLVIEIYKNELYPNHQTSLNHTSYRKKSFPLKNSQMVIIRSTKVQLKQAQNQTPPHQNKPTKVHFKLNFSRGKEKRKKKKKNHGDEDCSYCCTTSRLQNRSSVHWVHASAHEPHAVPQLRERKHVLPVVYLLLDTRLRLSSPNLSASASTYGYNINQTTGGARKFFFGGENYNMSKN